MVGFQYYGMRLKKLIYLGGWQDAENVGAVRELGFRTVRKPPRLQRLYGGGLGTVSERSRNGFGDRPIGTAARRTFARSNTEFVAGAALSQGQVQNSWHAQHFRKVKYRFCGRRSTLARSSIDLVAGTAFLQGQLLQPGLENRNF